MSVPYCPNCGGLCKIIVFQSLEGPIPEPVCTWDDCNIEVSEQQAAQKQAEFEAALKEAAVPGAAIPQIIQEHIKAGKILEILKSRYNASHG